MGHGYRADSKVIAVAVIVTLLAGLVQPPTASAVAQYADSTTRARGIPVNGHTLFGATSSSVSASQDPTVGEAKSGGSPYGVHRSYYRADQQKSAVNRARADLAGGRLPWLSFKLPNSYGFKQMAAGAWETPGLATSPNSWAA